MQNQVKERIKDFIFSLIAKDGLQEVISDGPFTIYLRGMKYVVTVEGTADEISISIRQENISSLDR